MHLTDAGLVSRWHSQVSTAHFAQRAEWDLSPSVHMYESETEPSESSNELVYSEIHVALRVARKPGIYVWDVLVPMSCICVLSLSSFTLRFTSSSGAGDRLSLVLVAVLTFFNFKSTGAMQDLPKLSYQTIMDRYLIGCFAFLVLVMLGNALVILGSESRQACAVAVDGNDGTFSDRPAWKRRLAVTLDHLLEAVYHMPVDDPRFDDELAQCTESGVNAIRFELLNEAFALVSLALLVLCHAILILWLSHRVESNRQWLHCSPPLNAWRQSRFDPSQTDGTLEHHGKPHRGCSDDGLSCTNADDADSGDHAAGRGGMPTFAQPVRAIATASALVARSLGSRSSRAIQRSASRQPSSPSRAVRSSSQHTSSRRFSSRPVNCSSSSLAREHTSNDFRMTRGLTSQRSAWSQLLRSHPQVASNSNHGDVSQQGESTSWHSPVHRVLRGGCASRVQPIEASNPIASVGAESDSTMH